MEKRIEKTCGGPMMAVDGLGRRLPTQGNGAGAPRKDRLVGMFYFLWLGEHGRQGPYDVSKIVAEDPAIGYKPESDRWGGIGVYHHWGEPFYGYYCSDDEWVARRHMKLLMQAGIDFLFFDTTNAVIYEKNAKMIMRILQEYHDAGWQIPRVMFYTNTRSGETVERLLEAIYLPGYCRDTWFYLREKPVIIAVPEECSARARDFFDIKLSQWPNEADKCGGWPWMDFTRPQRVFEGIGDDPATLNVSVAQSSKLREKSARKRKAGSNYSLIQKLSRKKHSKPTVISAAEYREYLPHLVLRLKRKLITNNFQIAVFLTFLKFEFIGK